LWHISNHIRRHENKTIHTLHCPKTQNGCPHIPCLNNTNVVSNDKSKSLFNYATKISKHNTLETNVITSSTYTPYRIERYMHLDKFGTDEVIPQQKKPMAMYSKTLNYYRWMLISLTTTLCTFIIILVFLQ